MELSLAAGHQHATRVRRSLSSEAITRVLAASLHLILRRDNSVLHAQHRIVHWVRGFKAQTVARGELSMSQR